MEGTGIFKRGDVVVHQRRPEWGEGVVDHAINIVYQGKSAQRVVVKFVNQGRVTVNTAVAPLANKTSEGFMSSSSTSAYPSQSGRGWLASLEKPNQRELWSLPEALTDPFTGLGERLKATMETYRFSTEARSLIEWAAGQTGLNDPLSNHNRHELEQAFARFARDRDLHLAELVRTIKREGKTILLERAMSQTKYQQARQALKKAIRA